MNHYFVDGYSINRKAEKHCTNIHEFQRYIHLNIRREQISSMTNTSEWSIFGDNIYDSHINNAWVYY